jgi:GT2 family glycosyltransferase
MVFKKIYTHVNSINEPSLSIIVINFGEEEYTRKLIPSLEKSTYRDFELIIGDVVSSNSNNSKVEGAFNYSFN